MKLFELTVLHPFSMAGRWVRAGEIVGRVDRLTCPRVIQPADGWKDHHVRNALDYVACGFIKAKACT